jgi:hypothetical protein
MLLDLILAHSDCISRLPIYYSVTVTYGFVINNFNIVLFLYKLTHTIFSKLAKKPRKNLT